MKFINDLDEEDKRQEMSRLDRAKSVDLVTLPEEIEGTNCGNCKFFHADRSYCNNEKVAQKVTPKMCCALWDAPGVVREWVKDEPKKTKSDGDE